jgi:hypothetical protein
VVVLQQATRTVPIVFVTVVDPVAAGLVDSLPRANGNRFLVIDRLWQLQALISAPGGKAGGRPGETTAAALIQINTLIGLTCFEILLAVPSRCPT